MDAGTTVFPNGQSAKAASLKFAIPNGIPMIVMQKSSPVITWPMAIHHPAVLSTADLGELAWNPPAASASPVHTALSRLRSTLQKHGVPDLVVTAQHGYRLDVQAANIDTVAFEKGAAELDPSRYDDAAYVAEAQRVLANVSDSAFGASSVPREREEFDSWAKPGPANMSPTSIAANPTVLIFHPPSITRYFSATGISRTLINSFFRFTSTTTSCPTGRLSTIRR